MVMMMMMMTMMVVAVVMAEGMQQNCDNMNETNFHASFFIRKKSIIWCLARDGAVIKYERSFNFQKIR
jgi:hypothetical protein